MGLRTSIYCPVFDLCFRVLNAVVGIDVNAKRFIGTNIAVQVWTNCSDLRVFCTGLVLDVKDLESSRPILLSLCPLTAVT